MTNIEMHDFISETLLSLKAAKVLSDEIWNTLFAAESPNDVAYYRDYNKISMFASMEGDYMCNVKNRLEMFLSMLSDEKSPSRVGNTQKGKVETT